MTDTPSAPVAQQPTSPRVPADIGGHPEATAPRPSAHSLADLESPWRQPQPCNRCGATATKIGPGAGPHVARLICGGCSRYLMWLSKDAYDELFEPLLEAAYHEWLEAESVRADLAAAEWGDAYIDACERADTEEPDPYISELARALGWRV